MEYTVGALANLAGISARTIRFYDEAGLLRPSRVEENGYRVYGPDEVDRLQQILFFRELGVPLKGIARILSYPDFDREAALRGHLTELRERRGRLDLIIQNVENTLGSLKGETKMQDKEKFAGLGQRLVEENEARYGSEIREKYGNEAVERSNARVAKMGKEEFDAAAQLSAQIEDALREAMAAGDPACPAARRACELHKAWLGHFMGEVSKEYHLALGQMYVEDTRFTEYYDKIEPGCAVFLRDAIENYYQ